MLMYILLGLCYDVDLRRLISAVAALAKSLE